MSQGKLKLFRVSSYSSNLVLIAPVDGEIESLSEQLQHGPPVKTSRLHVFPRSAFLTSYKQQPPLIL